MLSKKNNELLTRVGPGTGMGKLLRRFWMPGFFEEEVARPDDPPVRLRLLGEDLVAFKDSSGRIGVIEEHCHHRRASLYFGRNEECGLRCVYHGWKFDVNGNCVDMPSEPNPSKTLMAKAKLTSYATCVRGGVVWVYMGPAELCPPLPPMFEWSYLDRAHHAATKRLQQCNWAQAVEGGIDSSHISFLHANLGDAGVSNFNRKRDKYAVQDRHPEFFIKDTDYGMTIAARRNGEADSYYWRITQFLMPFYTMIPPTMDGSDSETAPISGHAWVPIDDENTWTWSFGMRHHRPLTDEERELAGGREGSWGPIDENYRPVMNRDNEYLMDREKQRTQNFTGIDGVPNQDAAVQESMGPITDRTRELLGKSDSAVVAWRKMIIESAKALQNGVEPPMVRLPETYNVRSATLLLDRDVAWEEGAAQLMQGGDISRSVDEAAE